MSILLRGKCSWFGGPDDTGVKRNEGLALVSKEDLDKFDGYFLDKNPPKTTGLARRLNPESYYIACRWNYKQTSREYLQGITVSVRNPNKPGILEARPVDWGPNAKTGRVADLSPGLIKALGLDTNGIVEVDIPLPDDKPKIFSGTASLPPSIFVDALKAPSKGLPVLTKQVWPLQRDCDGFYGNPRLHGFIQTHLIEVPVPWKMVYETAAVTHILINKRCADSLKRVLAYIWAACDEDQAKIEAEHLNRFSGSYNYRPMRGGSALSMHAYGAAIDWDDEHNQFLSRKHFFQADSLMVRAFEAEGWECGIRWTDSSVDSEHTQAARVHGG
jgi:D-alanyl-D-alanine carboxypeptidase